MVNRSEPILPPIQRVKQQVAADWTPARLLLIHELVSL
jgi:hypothetical protein